MRTALAELELVEPRDLGEALARLREAPLLPIAGCTDVYVGLDAGVLPARRFLNLWALDELRGIAVRDDVLVLGALTTHDELDRSPLVRARLPMLAAAAAEVGGPQIRNRGTLGGNLASGSPAGDTLPVLAVAEADVVLVSLDGERRVPFVDFYTGYRQTARRPDELLLAVEVPPVAGRQWFRKVGTRAAQAVSKVVMAAVRDGVRCRVAFGSVAPTVVRCPRTEAALATALAAAPPGSAPSIAAAQATLRDEIHPIDDLRSTAAHRLRVACNLLARFVAETE
jgi:CO/xanthine dehydrogenase FAD-binding subunit